MGKGANPGDPGVVLGTAYVFASVIYVHIKGLQKHSHVDGNRVWSSLKKQKRAADAQLE